MVYKKENAATYRHYSQIIWRNSTHMGAGRQRCSNGHEIWVCVYDPKGNKLGEKVY